MPLVLNQQDRYTQRKSHIKEKNEKRIGEMLLENTMECVEDAKVYHIILPNEIQQENFFKMSGIIYYRGALFCIINKHFITGKIYFKQLEESIVVYRRVGFLRLPMIQSVFLGWSEEEIYTNKDLNYKSYKNPVNEVDRLTKNLKEYLITRDRRFKDIFIMGFVSFSNEEVDLSEAKKIEPRLLKIEEIPEKLIHVTNVESKNEGWVEEILKDLLILVS